MNGQNVTRNQSTSLKKHSISSSISYSAAIDENAKRIYNTSRRKKTLTAQHRIGPVTPDDITINNIFSKNIGTLAIGNNKTNEDGKQENKLAGSKELLAYFFRLSLPNNTEEIVEVEYIKALFDAGADVNSIDIYGQTALHAAARDWHPDVANLLIDHGADVNKADMYGRTPLYIAAALNYSEMIEFLHSKGANIHERTYEEEQTPLHYAAKNNAVASVKCLLRLGADLLARDRKEKVPLHVAVQQGNIKAAQYLLDIGCPAAVYDCTGYSAMALMVEKMPKVANKALFQYISMDRIAGSKSFYLAPLETSKNSNDIEDSQRTVLEMIVKYGELDLLFHPVIRRLVKLKWDMYGRRHAILYLLLDTLYVVIWTLVAVLLAASSDPLKPTIENSWKLIIALLGVLMTAGFIIQQTRSAKMSQISENMWTEKRIDDLKEDLKYCHPKWPNEKGIIENQIERFENLVGDHFKSIWIYLEWFIAFAVIVLVVLKGVSYHKDSRSLKLAIYINATIIVFFVWCRFLKAFRGFRLGGQYIAILGQVMIALGQFAFLFMIFFIPFVVAFWILFGGEKNAEIIAKATDVQLSKAFLTLNDVIYSVWTLTVVVGFPMSAIQAVNHRLADIYVSLYYMVMSILSLNLFIALLSQVFAQVYNEAEKHASLERAKSILSAEKSFSSSKAKKFRRYMEEHCNPLIERMEFRETVADEILETDLNKIRHQTRQLAKSFHSKGDESTINCESFTIKDLSQEFCRIESNHMHYSTAITKLQKLHVENKKITKLLGLSIYNAN